MTFREEFPDFDPATLPAIPAEWTDHSWHNDSCPSFNTGSGTVVFINFADIQLREIQEAGERFSVHSDPEVHDSNDVLFQSDDWSKVLAFVISTKWVLRFGLGFHPDTPGKDYTPKLKADEIKEYDADMERLFALDCDPYECGLTAMRLHDPKAFA